MAVTPDSLQEITGEANIPHAMFSVMDKKPSISILNNEGLIMGNTAMKEIDNTGKKVNTAEIISFQSKLVDAPSIKRKSYERYYNDGGTLTERTAALNKAAELRTQLLQCRNEEPTNQQLSGFIDYLRKQDKRILDMIFHLANLSDKKEMQFDELTISEQKQFINAVNQVKALNALLPTHIVMPI